MSSGASDTRRRIDREPSERTRLIRFTVALFIIGHRLAVIAYRVAGCRGALPPSIFLFIAARRRCGHRPRRNYALRCNDITIASQSAGSRYARLRKTSFRYVFPLSLSLSHLFPVSPGNIFFSLSGRFPFRLYRFPREISGRRVTYARRESSGRCL